MIDDLNYKVRWSWFIMIKENLRFIKERIQIAAAKRGVSPEDITLIAVTKTVSAEMVRAAWDLGVTDFGENRVQDALPKIQTLPADLRWHFIGHLQTNKVKNVLPAFMLIHSLDSLRLAQALQNEGEKQKQVVHALVQVNIGSEESKSGFAFEEVIPALKEMAALSALKIQGLMAIAPFTDDPESVRPLFRRLFELYSSIQIRDVEMKYLSMGMSNDFEVAVEEGANMIRLGTSIFGERNY